MRKYIHKYGPSNIFALLIISGLILLHLLLLSKTFLIDSQKNMRAAVAGYGDIPFHMTQVSKFAFEKKIDFNEPIFDGERLRYAFFINLISGNVLRFSGNWAFAMQAPVMLFMASGIVLMFLSYRNFLKSALGASIAVAIFLFGSGLEGYFLVQNQLIAANRTPVTFTQYLVDKSVSTISKWDAKFPEQNVDWGAPLSLVFLHQRAFILGFFCFSLFWFLFNKWRATPKNTVFLAATGVVAGISPLAHYHSFVVMLVVLSVFGVWGLAKRNYHFVKRLMVMCAIAAVFALPQIAYLVQGKNGLTLGDQPFIKLRFGWMVEPTIGSIQFDPTKGILLGQILPFLNFLWINFGIILPVFLLAIIIIVSSDKFRRVFPNAAILAAIGLVLFIFNQLVRFQPWDYDNNKILVYFQFFAAPLVVALFIWISKVSKVIGFSAILVFIFAVTFTGVLDEIPRLLVPTEQMPVIFGTDAIAMGEFIKNNVGQSEKIVTTSTHLNPVSSLAGMPVLVGYPGWLWTRGINYGDREHNLQAFYQSPLHFKNILTLYHAKYVLVDPTAIYDWKVNTAEFDAGYKLLFRKGQYSLYEVI